MEHTSRVSPTHLHELLRGLTVAILIMALAGMVAHAQAVHASIRGAVVDPSGHGLRDVRIDVVNEQTRASLRVKTDGRGRFTVAEVPPGVYRITIAHPGYGKFVARTELVMNQDYWLDVPLQTGNMIQAVDVAAPFLPSDHDTPALQTFITDRNLNEWPMANGNFLELALLAPQTAPPAHGSATAQHGAFALNVAGTRDDGNIYLLDGVENVDSGTNTPAVRTPGDAIRQFRVFTSNYDASAGHASGGVISAVTKSGTNAFSGSVYEFGRGTLWGGRNHFAPKEGPPPEYSRNQFGGTLGGPLAKDHTFFFADYEHTRLREGITRITNVPTLAERSGDFSQTPFNRPIDFLTGQPFMGDVIPRERISAGGAAIAALYPEPNREAPSANYVSSPVLRDTIHQADVRIDHSLATGARLSGRYSVTNRRLFEPFGGARSALLPGFGTDTPTRAQNVAATLTHAPGSRLMNDIRVGYTRVAHRRSSETVTQPDLFLVNGYSPIGVSTDWPPESTTNAFQISDTATIALGHNMVKLGGQWRGIQRRTPAAQSQGFLQFAGTRFSGNALADLLLGAPAAFGGPQFEYPQDLRKNGGAVFVQDDWRPAPTFTVSAGLRYEYATPAFDAHDGPALYDPASRSVVRVGTGGMPRGGYVADRNNIAPRAGFAWTVGAERMNVIRGAYGVYFDEPTLDASEFLFLSPSNYRLTTPLPSSLLLFIPPSAVAYQRDLQTPRMDRWTINLQHQLGQSRAFELAYVGSRGHNLLAIRDLNQPSASPNRANPRPNPLFADITAIESRASSDYNGVHIRFQQRPATGTTMLVSYTIGKSMDDASGLRPFAGDPSFPQNSLDPGAERARSAFDVRHRFSGAITRPLPFNRGQFLGRLGIVSRLLEDSDLAAVATFATGRPFTVTLLPGIDNSNTGRSRFGFGTNGRPNVSGSAALARGKESAWFNTAVFSMPAFGTFGDSGRNTQTGPGYKSLDVALVRHIRLGTRDRATIDVRLEAFNLLSTVNYDQPDAFFGSPTFGRLLSSGSPRRVQFGVKALF